MSAELNAQVGKRGGRVAMQNQSKLWERLSKFQWWQSFPFLTFPEIALDIYILDTVSVKKPNWFGLGFINLKLKIQKKPEKNQVKPEKTKPKWKNQAKPVWTGFCFKKPNQTKTNRFKPVLIFFIKTFGLIIFFNKNST
jgi:hypothetical protein